MKIKVGVIFGGNSVEHEVSIITAHQAMAKLDLEKYEVVPIYITKDGEWHTGAMLKDIESFKDLDLIERYTKKVVLYAKDGRFFLQSKGLFRRIVNEIDIAFPIVHGTNCEDGVLQGYLQTVGIPYVGSNVYASAVGQDKVFMKEIFKDHGLNIPDYVWFFDQEYFLNKEETLKKVNKLKYPLVIKPACLGSSVGVKKVNDQKELELAIEEAIKYDTKIIVEEAVPNLRELNISVLGNYENQDLSVIEEVGAINQLLTYDDKYINGSKKGTSKGMASLKRMVPANLDKKIEEKIKDMAVTAFKALNSSGVVRIDFLVDAKKNEVYINEINNIPGSLSYYLWKETGKDYANLLDDLINIAVKDYKKRKNKVYSFKTNILESFSGLKGVKGMKGTKGIK